MVMDGVNAATHKTESAFRQTVSTGNLWDYPRMIFDLHLTCNQSCSYCVAGAGRGDDFGKIVEPNALERIKGFMRAYGPFNLILTGGEPLITPKIGELLSFLASEGHLVSLQSNLKSGVEKFYDSISPERTGWILATLHSVALPRSERFVRSVKDLRAAGYPVVVKLVLDGTMLEALVPLHDRLIQEKIPVLLSPLIHFPSGAEAHAQTYTPAEWSIIAPRITLRSSWLYFAGGWRSRGHMCRAGASGFYARANSGEIGGCAHNFPDSMGDLYENTLRPIDDVGPCGLDLCLCDYNYYAGLLVDLDERDRFQTLLEGDITPVTHEEYLEWINTAGIKAVHDLTPVLKESERISGESGQSINPSGHKPVETVQLCFEKEVNMLQEIHDPILLEQARRVIEHPNMDRFQFHEKAGQVEDGYMYCWDGTLWSVACADSNMIAYRRAVRGMGDPVELWAYMEILRNHPGGVKTVLEVGAGGGTMGMHAMNYNPETQAFMVEAHPEHFQATLENMKKNGFAERSQVLLAAVGAEAGRVVNFTDEGYGSNIDKKGRFIATQVTVGGLMVDLGLNELDILHMDVQGAEVNVLYGAEEELRRGSIRHIVIGTHSDGLQEMVRHVLEDYGFRITLDLKPSDSICADGAIVAEFVCGISPIAAKKPRERFRPDLNDAWIQNHYKILSEPFLKLMRDRSSIYLAIPASGVSQLIQTSGELDFDFEGGKVRLVLDIDGNVTSSSGRSRMSFHRSMAVWNSIPNLYGGNGALIIPISQHELGGEPETYHISSKRFKADGLDLEMNIMKDQRRWLIFKS